MLLYIEAIKFPAGEGGRGEGGNPSAHPLLYEILRLNVLKFRREEGWDNPQQAKGVSEYSTTFLNLTG